MLQLRSKREALGLTQQALADLIGVDRTAVAHIEAGRSMPSAQVLIRLCRALQLTAEERQELEAQLVPPASPVTAAPVASVVA